ncbi:MAG: DMT family transporter, partial [Deltaproteobacteria bacterium]|nr:DMT family transporter [Deltaproteobacteria bacterium]
MIQSMPQVGIGEVMALSCAACWATAVMLFRRVGPVDAKALNLFKNVLASALLLATMALLGHGWDTQRSTEDWLRLAGSAVLGLSIADTLFLAGLQRVGPSVAAVTDCIYSPIVMVMSALLIGEELRGGLLLGAPLVVLGLAVVAWQGRSALEHLDLGGAALCLGGVATTALAVVVAKPALNRSDLLEATTFRLVVGAVAIVVWDGLTGKIGRSFSLFRPQPAWRAAIPATLVGTYLSMLLWLGGIKYTMASRAALLNKMGTVFTLLLSAW